MKKIISDYKIETVLITIRKQFKMTQEKFANKIKKGRSWISIKEIGRDRIYMKDLIDILNKCNFDLYIVNLKDERKISITEYEPSFILKVMREWTELYMEDFSKSINKKKSWQSENEAGNINYYANDLFKLAEKHGFEIELIYPKKTPNKS